MMKDSEYLLIKFERLRESTKGNFSAKFDSIRCVFFVRIYGHTYEWTIPEAKCFVIGWNVNNSERGRTDNI